MFKIYNFNFYYKLGIRHTLNSNLGLLFVLQTSLTLSFDYHFQMGNKLKYIGFLEFHLQVYFEGTYPKMSILHCDQLFFQTQI